MSITGATARTNIVKIFDQSRLISNITYGGEFWVSQGQSAYPPPLVSPIAGGFSITFEAGRENTTPVADKFYALSGGLGHEYCPSAPNTKSPSQLNFFFAVNIYIQSAVVTAYLGQGNVGFNNNWWIGGECIDSTPFPYFVCNVGGQTARLGIMGDVETIIFYVVPA